MPDVSSFDYMNPDVPDELPLIDVPLIRATPESFRDYGTIVTDPDTHPVEIVTWPRQGWRPIDPGTGNEGGHVEGTFSFYWQGDILYAENRAVDDKYLLGWTTQPGQASARSATRPRDQLLIWHANYHPDGAQLFHPLHNQPFVVALALPGDDIKPGDWVAFYCDGSFGVCIHPNVWHEAIVPFDDDAPFFDRQGRVHGRVSCDFPREFGCFLRIPLTSKPGEI